MTKYFKIAVAQARTLQYKNCYNWAMVRYETDIDKCFYRIGNKLNVSTLKDAIELHKKVTFQKPYAVKPVQVAEFWGLELAVVDFAAENNIEPKILTDEFYSAVRPFEKKWQGYILKNVNDLSFIA